MVELYNDVILGQLSSTYYCTFFFLEAKNTLHFTMIAISKPNQCIRHRYVFRPTNINASIILLSMNIRGLSSSILLRFLRVKVVTERMYDELNVKETLIFILYDFGLA